MKRKDFRKYAIVISLILHFLLLAFYRPLSSIQLFSPKNIEKRVQEDQEKRITFELVETPEDAKSERPAEETNLVSDKNSRARDSYTAKDKESGMPFSRGDLDVKNIPGEVQQRMTDDENARSSSETMGEEELRREESSSESFTNPKFSRQALLGKTSPQQIINRPTYNNDKFNTEEIGGLSFNTYEWNFAPYLFAMKRKVENNIFPPPAFTRMGMIEGETILRFKVMPNGEVRDLTVLKYNGHKSLMETSVQAVMNSSPFKTLPADFPENHLEVTARFMYYIQK